MNMKTVPLVIFFILIYNFGFSQTSQDNRGDSYFYIGLMPVGAHVTTLLARPFAVAVYLGSNIIVGAEYAKVADSQYQSEYYTEKAKGIEESSDVSGTFVTQGAFVRFFSEGSSLNLLLAYHYRVWEGEGILSKNEDIATGSMKFESDVATIGFGNQWMADSGLTLGIDWYADSRAVERKITYQVTSNTGIPEDEVNDEIEDFGEFLNSVSALPGFFVITLGMSF